MRQSVLCAVFRIMEATFVFELRNAENGVIEWGQSRLSAQGAVVCIPTPFFIVCCAPLA